MTVTLTTLETLQGALTLVAVLVSIALGLSIILKYFKFKDKNLIYVGITWIGIFSPYWGDAVSYTMIITLGIQLDWAIYYIITTVFVSVAIFTWNLAFTSLLYKEKKKLIMIFTTILIIVYEIYLISMIIIDVHSVGTPKGPFIVEYAWYIDFVLICGLVYLFLTILLFVLKSLKSKNVESVLKGKFLLVALITFVIGAFTDTALEITGITITIARVFLIISSFSFYVGFILPDFIKKRILKER